MEKQRIFFIDYIKAFSISLIIISHCIGWWPVNDIVNKAILSVHVPIFFVAIGVLKDYLQRDEQLLPFIKKRARQLLIPYFWFSIYNSAVKLTMLCLGIGGIISMQALKNEAVDFFITGNGTVWFLMTLFLAESIFVYIKSLNKPWLLIISALALVVIPFYISNGSPFSIVINRLLSAYFYIVLGYKLAPLFIDKKMAKILAVVCIGAWLVLAYHTNWNFSFFNGEFQNLIATIPTIICGCVGIIAIFSMMTKEYKPLIYVGKNSLILMLVHPTFLLIGVYGIYAYLFQSHLSLSWHYILFSILLTIIVYALSILCIPIIHRYIPFVIGEKKNK